MKPSVPWETTLDKSLQDPKCACAYLNIAFEDEDSDMFLIALKNVTRATLGGMTILAEKTCLSRESLYRTLSHDGNPRFSTLIAVLDALGYKLAIEPKKSKRKKKASKKAARGKKAKRVVAKPRIRKSHKVKK